MYVLKKDKIEKIESLVLQGYGIRPICQIIGAGKQTVQGYRRRLLAKKGNILCPCGKPIGHKGFCNFRISISSGRQEWRKSAMTVYSPTILVRSNKPRTPRIPKELQPSYLKWPYKIGGNVPFYLEAINNVVPTGITEHIRADICQELATDYIAGELELHQLKEQVSRYIKKVYKQYSTYGYISLDAPVFKGSDLCIKDIITRKDLVRELRLEEN